MTLQQIARWKSQQNPLEKVCGKNSISPTITTRVAESIGGGINASTILYCEELEETTNIREFYMEEIKCKQVATLRGGKWEKTYEESRRVYGVDGIAPTVHTQGGGNQETKILVEPLAYNEQNGYLREDGIVGTLTTDGSSPKHNNRVVEPITDNRFFKQAFETVKENDCDSGDTIDAFNQKVNKSGVSPTVTTRPEGFKTAVLVVDEPLLYDGFNQQVKADSSTRGTITRNVGADLKRNGQGIIEPTIWGSLQEHCAVKQDGVCPTLTQAMGAGGGQIPMHNYDFRVRKLTEKECFRLQGVKDEDFAKIRENQSKSSCYHLAGDSITSSVLMALFGEMLEIDWLTKVNNLVEELKDKESDNE